VLEIYSILYLLFHNPDIVDWLSGCKYGFMPYFQNNWALHVSTIVTFLNYHYNLPNQPFNQQTIQRGL
jgi:hypothetical protein